MTLLTLGSLDSTQYGNNFGTATDADGVIDFTFGRTGDDLVLTFDGFDIDVANEVSVTINGQTVFLELNGNNVQSGYQLNINDTALTGTIGEINTITFEQTVNPTFTWGITDLLLNTASAAVEITVDDLGGPITDDYGNNPGGLPNFDSVTDVDGEVEFVFAKTDGDLLLSFNAYDVDTGNEMRVLLNGTEQVVLDAGVNEDLQAYSIRIEAGAQTGTVGELNTITFEQLLGDANTWGVTDLEITTITPPSLIVDDTTLDTNSYGNNFNGQFDADGEISFTFTPSGSDLELNFDGYDIDFNNEVKVFVNGVDLGFIDAGVNNGVAAYTVAIDAATAGLAGPTGTITFSQEINDTFKWGVTNLELVTATVSPPPPPPPPPGTGPFELTLDVTDTADYGHNPGGLPNFDQVTDADGEVSFTFAKTGNDLTLSLDAYDIDFNDEVRVWLNGVDIGFLDQGVNNNLSSNSIAIADASLTAGDNTITFEQNINDSYVWGVTNLTLTEGSPPPPPPADTPIHIELGIPNTDQHGNNFGTATDTDGEVSFSFHRQNPGEDLVFTLDGFDVDFANEVKVLLNGVDIGFLEQGVNDGFSAHTINVADVDLTGTVGELNTITFEQNTNDTWKWGVTNVEVNIDVGSPPPPPAAPDAHLELGTTETGQFGNKFGTANDTDGEVFFTFDRTGSDLTLFLDGYDVDFNDEVQVFVNGVDLGFLAVGVNNGTSPDSVAIADSLLAVGVNTVTFQQATDNNWKWGVTNLLLTDAASPPPPPPPVAVDAHLELNTVEGGQYGNQFGTANDLDGEVVFTFARTGDDLTGDDFLLNLEGFDVDRADEVRVKVNGVDVGFLDQGVNDGTSPDSVLIDNDLLTGSSGTVNTITFEQAVNDTWKWGVTNLELTVAASPPPPPPPPPPPGAVALQLDTMETGEYGYNFGSATNAGDASFTFFSTGTDLTLSLNGYDIDFNDEVEVLLNGAAFDFLDQGLNNAESPYQLSITTADMTAGENTITFDQVRSETWTWGVTDLLLEQDVIV